MLFFFTKIQMLCTIQINIAWNKYVQYLQSVCFTRGSTFAKANMNNLSFIQFNKLDEARPLAW